jgi:hypothetical protein
MPKRKRETGTAALTVVGEKERFGIGFGGVVSIVVQGWE